MKKNGWKKLIGKTSTGIIVTILAFVIVFGAIFAVSGLTLASDSLAGIVNIRNDITEGEYRVLEIVPSRDVAEFGYLVGGEEPLDAATLYDSTNGEWITWQKYLSDNVETMDATGRATYLNNIVASKQAYISPTEGDLSKPMWYETYVEGVAPEDADGVLVGGNTPVYGWLVKNDDTSVKGWNAKFTMVTGKTYEQMMGETTPYYIVDKADMSAETALTIADIENSTYPDYYYTYRKDGSNAFYNPSITFGELKEDVNDPYGLVDPGEEADEIGNYYILKFKVLESTDYTLNAGPVVYGASDILYLEEKAPYTIPENNSKWHKDLTKPSHEIYYKGGLFSNELFKRHTLNVDPGTEADYNVNVQTITAAELNAFSDADLSAYLANVDFIYINAGKYTAGGIVSYSHTTNDISEDKAKTIFEKICNAKIPCIVDYYIKELAYLDGSDSISNSYMYGLACMLMQNNYRSFIGYDIDDNLNSWVTTIVSTNSHNYVNGNVMVINSLSSYGKLTDWYYDSDSSNAYNMSDSNISAAYKAVVDEIELENLYRAADQTANYSSLSTDVFKATVVRYIMSYATARSIEKKTSIEVLEIQPGNVKYPGNSGSNGAVSETELTPSRVRTWLGVGNNVSVNITTMNTIEFIGTIEDLNSEYDLIYIGADIYGLPQRKSSSENRQVPDYKERDNYDSMDYLIYTNIGGLTKVKAQFAGHLDTDYIAGTNKGRVNTTVWARYNGNDITADKHNQLVDYVKGTYPVVVADILCNNDNVTPDTKRVDNCTYLYAFLKGHLKDNNVFKASEVESGQNANFKFFANRGKLNIGKKVVAGDESSVTGGTAFVQPGAYKAVGDTTNKQVTYISKENGKYFLKYKFTITNNGAVFDNTRYTANLFLDSNSDGKFSEEYETLADITITHVASGKTVRNGELLAGEQYTVSRQVPENFSGLLTWKVEVSQTSNKFIRDSITGYTRLDETPKATIKVLQVRRDGGTPLILADAIGTASGNGANNTLNALVWGGKCNRDGKTYAGIANDYEFKFTTMTNAQFNNAVKNKKHNNKTFNLMDYDMLVLGFYDSYDLRYSNETDINYNSVEGSGGIKEFIDSGKSVLFAHDTTSVTAVSNYKSVKVGSSGDTYLYTGDYGANVWGYYLNMYIRDMVGLDTYGITLASRDGINNFSELRKGIDLNTTTKGQQLMAALKNDPGADGYCKIGLKPVAYLPNSGKTKTVPEVQGFPYGWMDITWKSDDIKYRKTNSSYNTYNADKVNEGAITTYPYYLEDEIDIARTHHQYYTIDLYTDDDKDGETDLVVWYTMGGNYNNTSRKDVLNNYYIYNKGNITYTGFGDFNDTSSRDGATVVDECKLFVNTLVAAYGASVKPPQVTVYESEENLTPTTTFYEYGDAINDMALRTDGQRMYFSISDMNVIRGTKVASADYYVKLKTSTSNATYKDMTTGKTYQVYKEDTGGGSYNSYIKLTDLKTYTNTGQEVTANNLQCGVVYYVDIPPSVFDISGVSGQNTNTFMVSAKTILKKTGSLTGIVTEQVTSTSYHKIDFVHVELFPLD